MQLVAGTVQKINSGAARSAAESNSEGMFGTRRAQVVLVLRDGKDLSPLQPEAGLFVSEKSYGKQHLKARAGSVPIAAFSPGKLLRALN